MPVSGWLTSMRDRGGEFAGRRHAVGVRQFGHGIACHHLGQVTTPMLVDEPRDQCRLSQQYAEDGRDHLVAIQAPRCSGPREADLAPRAAVEPRRSPNAAIAASRTPARVPRMVQSGFGIRLRH